MEYQQLLKNELEDPLLERLIKVMIEVKEQQQLSKENF